MSSSYIEAAVQGRLGSSQMQRKTGAGKPFVTLSLAVSAGQGEPAEWVNVAVFEPLVHELPEGLVAGERCYCEGRLKVNRWKSKDGEPRANLQLTASCFLALDRIGRRRRPSRVKAGKDQTNGEASAAAQAPLADHPQDEPIPF